MSDELSFAREFVLDWIYAIQDVARSELIEAAGEFEFENLNFDLVQEEINNIAVLLDI